MFNILYIYVYNKIKFHLKGTGFKNILKTKFCESCLVNIFTNINLKKYSNLQLK